LLKNIQLENYCYEIEIVIIWSLFTLFVDTINITLQKYFNLKQNQEEEEEVNDTFFVKRNVF
jgi:hypothetical protein